jgi:hypothetical protein
MTAEVMDGGWRRADVGRGEFACVAFEKNAGSGFREQRELAWLAHLQVGTPSVLYYSAF